MVTQSIGTRTPSSDASASSAGKHQEDGEHIIDIAAYGDVVLRIEHENGASKAVHSFRVSSPILKKNSKYFDRLLQPGRFGEALDVEAKHKTIREEYGSLAEAPSSSLPTLNIKDIGRISAVRAVDALITDFLYIMHGKDTQTFPPVLNLANLAIVADRFDAIEIVKSYVRSKKMIKAIDGKTNPKVDSGLSEDKVRQRLLVAIMLDYPPWVEKYSARMVTRGWAGKEVDVSAALWWDLPSRVEEELAYRRECVLETIQSLQANFLSLYNGRTRQCKLGYDSSPECDSFQLGEMVQFFTRIGTLRLQGIIIDNNDPPAPYSGDLYTMFDSLRQCPEYQVDKFHSHCGLRTRILPFLELLEHRLKSIGICYECWQTNRQEYAWIDAKRPLMFKAAAPMGGRAHLDWHRHVRALFTATEKDWS